MLQVLFRVGGVDHQKKAVLKKTVEIGIVHGAAALRRDDTVLSLVEVQRQNIAAQDML